MQKMLLNETKLIAFHDHQTLAVNLSISGMILFVFFWTPADVNVAMSVHFYVCIILF